MTLLAQILAQAPAQQTAPGWTGIVPLALIGLVFWFLLIMPMRRQEKQRKELVASVKKSDRIINSGGIIGIVESVKEQDDEVVLRGGLRITKSSIVKVIPADSSAKE
jgi:preprotein translocase subunit YajC